MSVSESCTEECEAMPECALCGRRKAPHGRSVAVELANGLCDWECEGYTLLPIAGHLRPGELAAATRDVIAGVLQSVASAVSKEEK